MKLRKYTLPVICATFMMLLALQMAPQATIIAQDRVPVREFTNPDELITLGRETSLQQSFQIIGSFSRRFGDKVLIDRSGKTGPIGITVANTHWRQALDAIATNNDLRVTEFPDFIEITQAERRETTERPSATPGRTPTSQEILASMETREVEISAIFFEGNRSQLRELGIDWTAIQDGVVRITNLAAASVSLEALQVEMSPQTLGGDWEVTALLNTLESLNIGEILSSPRIKVIDGKRGNVQIGQDFSIKQRDFAGNVTDAFYSTGTILTVTPTIIHESDTSFIFLDLRAERSSAQPDPVSTIINKQEAQTQVLLYSGESTVIAGLFEMDEQIIRRGVPFLKDLPPWFFGIRYLFGYNAKSYIQKELIIVVKAELVPSMRDRFNLERGSPLEVLQEGRDKLQESNLRKN